jgi:oligopeptidase A
VNNPLLSIQADIPFARIAPEHVREATETLLASAKQALLSIAPPSATYAETLGALEKLTEGLDFAMGLASHLESVKATPEFREAFNSVQPQISAFYSGIPLNQSVYDALKGFAETAEAQALDPIRARLLSNTLADFRRNGAGLPPEKKKRAEEIDVRLTEVTLKFSQNVTDDSARYEWVFPDAARLSGLPPSALAAAQASASEKGKSGYRLTLDAPSYGPAMMYLDDRALREELYLAHSRRGTSTDFDNKPLIAEILALRQEKAALLGYASFADLVLENRMAKRGKTALDFVARVEGACREAAKGEAESLAAFAKNSGLAGEVAPWDIPYYAEKERKALYDLDEEELKPYFELSNVLAGVFALSQKLYGLTFEKRVTKDASWHPDVEEYAVTDSGGVEFGRFFLDLFPREAKRDGAWMHGILDRVPGTERSVALIVGNMTKPVNGKSLLTHREVETVFHEFGHLLHHLLSEVPVRSLSGTKVAWDFVELPSQIMENFCWDQKTLSTFAKHVETGEVLPDALFTKLERAKNYRAASMIMRQLGFATADLLLHTEYNATKNGDAVVYAREVAQRFIFAPLPADYAMIASFLHLFSSPVGYAAGYYSYQWAEVLDADAYAMFEEEGAQRAGQLFREHILSKGDSQDPAALYRAFRGRDPDEKASLRRAGLVS